MTTDDLARLETELGIGLPASYKKVMVAFPVPAYASNTETMLWDDADALVALNRELRAGRSFAKPWPRRFFALGQDAGGCSDALDLDDPESGVFWFDRQHVNVAFEDRSPEKIEQWLMRQVRELSSDLVGDGIDPMDSPETRKQIVRQENRSSNFAALFFVAIIAAAVVVGIWIGMRR